MINKTSLPNQRAFTMIELLVVATIVIILTTLALVSFAQANMSVRNSKRKADLETMRQALMLYRQDNGYYAVGSTVTFAGLANDLYSDEYLSEASLQDPRHQVPYVYQAACDSVVDGNCMKIILQAALEPNGDAYEIIAL